MKKKLLRTLEKKTYHKRIRRRTNSRAFAFLATAVIVFLLSFASIRSSWSTISVVTTSPRPSSSPQPLPSSIPTFSPSKAIKLSQMAGVPIDKLVFEGSEKELTFKFLTKSGRPEQVTENLKSVLDHLNIIVRYNQIRKRSEIIIPNFQCILDEYDNTTLTLVTDEAVKAGLSPSRIDEFVNSIASKNLFCPVRTYIESNSWTGVDCLEQFYSQINSSDEFMTRLLFKKWFIQAVAAIYEDQGLSGSGVIVLTGAQGAGKTRLFKDMTRDIPSVFLEGAILNPSDKDSVMIACSNWIVELGELDATFRKSDIAQLKGFLTKNKYLLRRPYDRK